MKLYHKSWRDTPALFREGRMDVIVLSHDRTSAELLRYVDMFQGKATVHKIGQPTKWKHVKPFRVWHRDDPAIQKLIAVENLLHNANV